MTNFPLTPRPVTRATFGLTYCAAIMSTVGAALGLLCALLWRDLILGILKRHGVWDSENGLSSLSDVAVLGAIALATTLLTALAIVAGGHLCPKS